MHDDELEHVHADEGLEEERHPLWLTDQITLTSVGIDIGSATSQVIFSRLHLRRMGHALSSRYVVVGRESLYRSPVHLTQYSNGGQQIDDRDLAQIVDAAYQSAGLRPEEVDTGAVILTGEAMRRENARAIADLFAAQRGDFVCATAGHHMEALLAAHGSGAVAWTEGQPSPLLNIDIGGGTTKLAIVERGRVLETAALHIGGRLLAVDEQGQIARLEPGGQVIARLLGFTWQVGDKVSPGDLERMAAWMADAIIAAVSPAPLPPEVEALFLTPRLSTRTDFSGVIFSGGVSEYVYGNEGRSFGDLGRPLGRALRERLEAHTLPWPLLPARECIRATVVGASQYSVQVSGNTIYISAPDLLPRKNLQVLRPSVDLSGAVVSEQVAQAIANHFTAFDLIEGETDVALAFQWQGDASFHRLAAFARGLQLGLPRTVREGRPLFLVVDNDMARLMGALLKEEWQVASEVLAIDGIILRDFDFIDIGRKLEPSGTVPVTIKSLVFHL